MSFSATFRYISDLSDCLIGVLSGDMPSHSNPDIMSSSYSFFDLSLSVSSTLIKNKPPDCFEKT